MRLSNSAAVVVVTASLCVPALAAAQEPPARDFTRLYTRLVPGDTVWVTDAQGREVKGEIGDALEPRAGREVVAAGPSTLAMSAKCPLRRGDRSRSGATWIGMAIGALRPRRRHRGLRGVPEDDPSGATPA